MKVLREDGALQVCFCAFDLLLLNGRVVTDLPLTDRWALLQDALIQQPGRLVISQHELVHDK